MDPKPHKTYEAQIELLIERGLVITDPGEALKILHRIGYYTLSGYLYPFRLFGSTGTRLDDFQPGIELADVELLWDFDNQLRAATFAALQQIETFVRSVLAYELGKVDPLIHQRPDLLRVDNENKYQEWVKKLSDRLADSRDDALTHHRQLRAGVTPIWVVTDALDWGGLSHLFAFSPHEVRKSVAEQFDLSAAQMKSWLRALNHVRNICAHHARFFNRAYINIGMRPKTGRGEAFEEIRGRRDTTFAMLMMIQYLGSSTRGFATSELPTLLASFPTGTGMTLEAMGAPANWADLLDRVSESDNGDR